MDKTCDKCKHHSWSCVWPEGKGKWACIGCSGRRMKCLLGGQPMTNWPLKADGPVKKKPRITSKLIIESEDDDSVVEVTTPVKSTGLPTAPQVDQVFRTSDTERALWAIAAGVGGLLGEVKSTREVLATELCGIREALECQGDATLVLHDKVAKCVWMVGSLAHGESGEGGSGMEDKGKGKEKEKDDDETLVLSSLVKWI